MSAPPSLTTNPHGLPALPRRMARRSATSRCSRPNCWLEPVVTFGWAETTVLSFCATHAEDKAGQLDVEVLWVSPLHACCDTCHRIVSKRVMWSEDGHYDLKGESCPGTARRL